MEHIELKVIGLDALRPPRLQSTPCIDLFFQLNEPAPKLWCEVFMYSLGRQQYPVKIDPEVGEFIETWVRKPGEIQRSLDNVKTLVANCNEQYQLRLNELNKVIAGPATEVAISPEQKALNDTVAALNWA